MRQAAQGGTVMVPASPAALVAMLQPVPVLHRRRVLTPLPAAPRMRWVVQAAMDKGPSEVPAARRAQPLLLPIALVQHTQMRMRRAA